MANQLDLEEQEQLDQIKHYWKQYGNLITWALILVLAVFAGWNFYHYWQRNQAQQAAALFDEVERALQSSDAPKLDRVFADMKDKFSSTTYAQQTGLMVAKYYVVSAKLDAAKAALSWLAAQSSDAGYRSIAKLRLAAILLEGKDYAAALSQLDGDFPASFAPLVADRRADLLLLQGQKQQALAEYEKAYRTLDATQQYRHLIEVKLNALGVDVAARDAHASAVGN